MQLRFTLYFSLFTMTDAPLMKRHRFKSDLLYLETVVVCHGDDGDFGDACFFVEGELVLRFDPEGLFALERGGDDEFVLCGDIAVYAEGLEGDTVFDEGQCDHTVKLLSERLVGGEVFDKGEVVHDHLFAAAFDGVVDEVEQPFTGEALDRTVDEVFGDTEMLFGEGVDLVGGHRLGVVACEDEDERLFVG